MVYTAPMPVSLKARLCLMMFLNYVIWGSWYVTLNTYLTVTLKFTGTEAGAIFGTTALAINMEPVYAILLAIVLLDEQRELRPQFYLGVVIVFLVVFSHPFMTPKRSHH